MGPSYLPALSLANVPTGTGLGTMLSLAVRGSFQDGGDVSGFVGVLTAQFTTSFQALLGTLAGGGSRTSSHSAVFEVVLVPEPHTGLLVVLGASILGALRRGRGRGGAWSVGRAVETSEEPEGPDRSARQGGR